MVDQLSKNQKAFLMRSLQKYFSKLCRDKSRLVDSGILYEDENMIFYSGNGVGAYIEKSPNRDNWLDFKWKVDNSYLEEIINRETNEIIHEARVWRN